MIILSGYGRLAGDAWVSVTAASAEGITSNVGYSVVQSYVLFDIIAKIKIKNKNDIELIKRLLAAF